MDSRSNSSDDFLADDDFKNSLPYGSLTDDSEDEEDLAKNIKASPYNTLSFQQSKKRASRLQKKYWKLRDRETLTEELNKLQLHKDEALTPQLSAHKKQLEKKLALKNHKPKKFNLEKFKNEIETEHKIYQELKQEQVNKRDRPLEAENTQQSNFNQLNLRSSFPRHAYVEDLHDHFYPKTHRIKEETPPSIWEKIKSFLTRSINYIGNALGISFSIGSKGAQMVDDVPSAMQSGLLTEELAETIGTYMLSGAGITIFGIEAIRSGTKLIKTTFNIAKTLFDSTLTAKERWSSTKNQLKEAILPAVSFGISLGGLVISGLLLSTIFGASLVFAEYLPFLVTVGVACLSAKEFVETIKTYFEAKALVKQHLTPKLGVDPLKKAKDEYIEALKRFNVQAKEIKDKLKELKNDKATYNDDCGLKIINDRERELDKNLAELIDKLNKKKVAFEELDKLRINLSNAKAEVGFAAAQLALSIGICILVGAGTAAIVGASAAGSMGIAPTAIIIAFASVGLAIKVFQEVVKYQTGRKDYTYLDATKDLFVNYPIKLAIRVKNFFSNLFSPKPTPAPKKDKGKEKELFGSHAKLAEKEASFTPSKEKELQKEQQKEILSNQEKPNSSRESGRESSQVRADNLPDLAPSPVRRSRTLP